MPASCRPRSASLGFTLLELLLVVALLAAIGGGIVAALGEVRDSAMAQNAQREMAEIKTALLNFRRDTGYFPGQGPFALATDGGGNLAADCTAMAADSPGAVDPLDGRIASAAWFRAPANFFQLLERPRLCATHPQASLSQPWDARTQRGWRGPYLSAGSEGRVDTGDGLGANGAGQPVQGAALLNLYGMADPFFAAPVQAGGYLPCDNADAANCLLDFRRQAGVASHSRWGRPYLLFELGDVSRARIVSLGPDGRYAGVINAATPCAPPLIDGAEADDLVLCLLR